MTVKVCASITAGSLKEIGLMADKAEKDGADLLEVRLDYAQKQYSLDEVRRLSELPLIATNRAASEGGFFGGSEDERIARLSAAAEADFDFVDVELSTEDAGRIIKKLADAGAGTIVSVHVFDATADLSKLNSLLRRELRCHADICKIVVPAKEFEDNLTCLRFVEEASKKTNVACFCVGELGVTSRLVSPLFGACFTYAAVERGREAAKGQLTVAEMRGFYDILGV